MMTGDILLILLFFGGSLIVMFIVFMKKLSELKGGVTNDQTLVQWLQAMQQSLEKTNSTLSLTLNQNNQNISEVLNRSTAVINQRLDAAVGVVADATKELTRMNELGKSIQDLQLLLQSPKLRGNFSEEILGDMLGQVFPKGSFFLQHSFKSGVKVDAAIKTVAGSLCIDAKFPMENFQKKVKAETESQRLQFGKLFIADVKKHIKDISQKYILPEEGTVDFAFMYIPSENVFYEIANSPEILDYARSQRVYPVSPNTLYIHLQTVLLSFEGQKIESRSKQVMALLKALQKDYSKLDENLQLLGKHLHNASAQYTNTSSQFTVLGQKLNQQEMLEGPDTVVSVKE